MPSCGRNNSERGTSMTVLGWVQILLYCAIVPALVQALGPCPIEVGLYRLGGVDAKREQHWVTYAIAMLFFHVAGFLILYGLMRLQAVLPYNPAGQSAVAPDLAFNTAISFITNTNWQNYA